MTKSCLALAFFCFIFALPLQAFDWETATSRGREYVSLRSFCAFYGFGYQAPSGNDRFVSRNGAHSISLKLGNSDLYLDGTHYVMSFPVEGGDHDWLISRMDTIKLFDPILRPTEISGRHAIRGVVIDAGHGGSDNGATSRFGSEKNYTLDTANRLAKILNDAGIKTMFTRRSDVFVDLYERAHIASLYPDYAFVSIHFNSATEEARGLETYCLSPRGAASTSSAYLTRGDIQKLPGNDYDTQNILLASMVHSEIIKLNPGDSTADRGVKRARFVVIKQNVLPAILVEGGFVSNHMEAARVNRPDYRQSLAQDIARGVVRFINSMGDRKMALPGGSPVTFPVAKPVAVAPVAPSGMAHDPANSHVKAPAPPKGTPGTTAPATAVTTGSHHKATKDKTKKTAVTPSATPAPAPAPTPTPPPATTSESSKGGSTPSGPLTLKDSETPPPTVDAPGATPEPDEPPTVNSMPPTPATNGASTTKPAAKKTP